MALPLSKPTGGYLRLSYTGAVGVSGVAQQSWDLSDIPRGVRQDESFRRSLLIFARPESSGLTDVAPDVSFIDDAAGVPSELVLTVTAQAITDSIALDVWCLHSVIGAVSEASKLYFIGPPGTGVVGGALTLYVSPTGDDTASGTSTADPIQTLLEVDNRIGDTEALVEVNFAKGDYEMPDRGWWLSSRKLGAPVVFRADDVWDPTVFTEIASGLIGPGSTTSVLDIAGLAVDLGAYNWIEILDGPAAGQRRSIRDNTAVDLTVVIPLTAVPVDGNSYRILTSDGVNFVAPTIAGVAGADYTLCQDQLGMGVRLDTGYDNEYDPNVGSGGGGYVFEGVRFSDSPSFSWDHLGSGNYWFYGVNQDTIRMALHHSALFCGKGLWDAAKGVGLERFDALLGWGLNGSASELPIPDRVSMIAGYYSFDGGVTAKEKGRAYIQGNSRVGRIFETEGQYFLQGGSEKIWMHTDGAQALVLGGSTGDFETAVFAFQVDILGSGGVIEIFEGGSLLVGAGFAARNIVDGSNVVRMRAGGQFRIAFDASGIGNGVANDWEARDWDNSVLESWNSTFFAAVGAAKGPYNAGATPTLVVRVP